MTRRSITLALAALLLGGSAALAVDVAVEGSDTTYPAAMEATIGGKATSLVLTGAAQRKKAVFKVYTIASYVEKGVAVAGAEELAGKDAAKQLHLVMERDVDGQTMAEAFVDGIDLNYKETEFPEQKKQLLDFMTPLDLKTGDHVRLTHVPGVGFHCAMPGGRELLVKDVAFSVAIWSIYLGENPVKDSVKQGLGSRLPIGQ